MLTRELDALATDGLGDAELEDTRSQLKGQMMISLESPGTRMNRLAGVGLFGQPFRTVDEVAGLIDAVDAEQCSRAAELFAPERSAVLVLSPQEEGEEADLAPPLDDETHEPITQERPE